MESQLITPQDAAKYLCISERKLWQLTADGRLPVVRMDRCKRYDVADLHKFIDDLKAVG